MKRLKLPEPVIDYERKKQRQAWIGLVILLTAGACVGALFTYLILC